MSVEIVKSAINPRCYNPDSSLVSGGPPLYMHCSNTVDSGNPFASSFQGNFDLAWGTSNDLRPCFPRKGKAIELEDMARCVTEYSQPRIAGDGGMLYHLVSFNSTQGYCRLGRGVTAAWLKHSFSFAYPINTV